jgi:hypothetical protein
MRRRTIGLAIALRLITVAVLATASPEPITDGVVAIERLATPQLITLKGDVFHVQGLDIDDDAIYVTSVDRARRRAYIHKFALDGALIAARDLTDGGLYHPGGIALDGETIWVPVAEYRARGSSRIVQLDKATLHPRSSFAVADHIGAVAVSGEVIHGANWDAERLYVWDRRGTSLDTAVNTTGVAYQDMKAIGGYLVASGVMRHRSGGAIDWLHPESLALARRLTVGNSMAGPVWTHEGMAVHGDRLYLMPADGRNGTAQVYVFPTAILAEATQCEPAANAPCLRGTQSPVISQIASAGDGP